MAITGNASYIPTMDLFIAHWALADGAIAPREVIVALADGSSMGQAGFDALRTTLLAKQTEIQGLLNDQQIARGDIDIKKAQLLGWLNEFVGFMDAYYSKTKFANARPKVPGIGDGQATFLDPMQDAKTLWVKLNANPAPPGLTLPLVLADATTAATFGTAVTALEEAYKAEAAAVQTLKTERGARGLIQDRAYDAMKMYRQAVPPLLAQHPDVVDSMPALSPIPGHTPDPVDASALFEAPDKSKVAWDASQDGDLDHYQLRGTVGDEYDADDAVVIATAQPADPREIVTSFGLTQAGAKVALKLFVILTTGNEAGSATMVVTRPS